MYKVAVHYVCVADTRTGSVAVQPHTIQNFNLSIEHTMSLSDEMGNRAFDKFLGITITREAADTLVTQWQCDFLDDRDNLAPEQKAHVFADTFAGLTRREIRGRDLWSDDPDRMTRRG